MQKDIFNPDNGDVTIKNENVDTQSQETYTKPVRDGLISYIEREVDRFDYDGYEVVRRELFSKANCPAVTLKYGSVNFNVRAIRKLGECRHIQVLINSEKKLMIAKPCGEDEKDSVQWSKIDKHGKIGSRKITGKVFTAQLFNDMKWDFNGTIKVLGTLLKCKDEKIFVFDLVNAEAYLSISAPSPDNPKRRERVPLMPSHWQGTYGQSYEESKVEIVKTFEGMPEGFVKIILPQLPSKKQAEDKVDQNEIIKEETNNGTV
jgi:hypothetical protein